MYSTPRMQEDSRHGRVDHSSRDSILDLTFDLIARHKSCTSTALMGNVIPLGATKMKPPSSHEREQILTRSNTGWAEAVCTAVGAGSIRELNALPRLRDL
eukprot:764311-Hanusia_phi.AAC.6